MRILIFDEEFLFSEALSSLLSRRGHDVVGCATTWPDFAEYLEHAELDVCLVTTSASRRRGADIIKDAHRLRGDVAIVALGDDGDVGDLLNELKSGADGVCLKADGIDEIESVLLGTVAKRQDDRGPIAPEWSRGALALTRHKGQRTGAQLTQKERAVLDLLISGASTPAIAAELEVGEATIRTHLQHLFGKFGVHSRLALVAHAIRTDIVQLDERSPISFR
jgi:two-component system nitrate/nitrite response regulator NarL